jgi:hypothetical protein
MKGEHAALTVQCKVLMPPHILPLSTATALVLITLDSPTLKRLTELPGLCGPFKQLRSYQLFQFIWICMLFW